MPRSEEHTSELQSPCNLVCRLLLEKTILCPGLHLCADAAHHVRLGGRFAPAARGSTASAPSCGSFGGACQRGLVFCLLFFRIAAASGLALLPPHPPFPT